MRRSHATAGVVAAAAFAALAILRDSAAVVHADGWLQAWRAGHPPSANDAGRALDRLGGHWWLPPVVALAVLHSWWRGRRGDAALLVAASAGADLFLHLVKALVDTPRAGEGTALPATGSFPSGHATTALTILVTLAVVGSRTLPRPGRIALVAGAALLAGAVGAGRWLDGLRAASDVVGGLLLGVVCLAGIALLRPWLSRLAR